MGHRRPALPDGLCADHHAGSAGEVQADADRGLSDRAGVRDEGRGCECDGAGEAGD